jgi:hypothetical protein
MQLFSIQNQQIYECPHEFEILGQVELLEQFQL